MALEVVTGATVSIRKLFETLIVSVLLALSTEYQLKVWIPSPDTVKDVPCVNAPESIL